MTIKSPSDKFLCSFVVYAFSEAYSYAGYMHMKPEWWVKDRINEVNWSQEDRERAYKLVGENS